MKRKYLVVAHYHKPRYDTIIRRCFTKRGAERARRAQVAYDRDQLIRINKRMDRMNPPGGISIPYRPPIVNYDVVKEEAHV